MNESAFTDDKGNLVSSEYIRWELIYDNDLIEDTLDCSDVNAVLAACEELNSPSKLSTEEAQVASAVVYLSLVYGKIKLSQNGMVYHQVKIKLELSLLWWMLF